MQCGNIASRTNGVGCIYIRNTHVPNKRTYRQFFVFTTSVGLAALAPIKFFPIAATGINKGGGGGHVPLMWPAALCSGLAALSRHVAGRNFEEILQHLKTKQKKNKKKTLKRCSSSLNVTVPMFYSSTLCKLHLDRQERLW